MQVELFKRVHTYKNANGEEKTGMNFYIRCGEALVPIDVRFFKGQDGRDQGYQGRKMILSSFATILPEKEKKQKPESN